MHAILKVSACASTMYRLNKPGWRIVGLLYFARLLKHSFHLITERFLCGSIILTVRPNTARTVGNKTCQKRFVERSLNLEITHYAAASRRNCDTHTHSVYTTWRRVMLRQPAWRHWKPSLCAELLGRGQPAQLRDPSIPRAEGLRSVLPSAKSPAFTIHPVPVYLCTLSTLISSHSLNHHLYADDTQIFVSFRPPDFHSNLTHLQDVLQRISSWMTANLPEYVVSSDSVNSFKERFDKNSYYFAILHWCQQVLSQVPDQHNRHGLTVAWSTQNCTWWWRRVIYLTYLWTIKYF